jgi:hypothetical protein
LVIFLFNSKFIFILKNYKKGNQIFTFNNNQVLSTTNTPNHNLDLNFSFNNQFTNTSNNNFQKGNIFKKNFIKI